MVTGGLAVKVVPGRHGEKLGEEEVLDYQFLYAFNSFTAMRSGQ